MNNNHFECSSVIMMSFISLFQDIHGDTKIPDINGEMFFLIDVISLFIKYLKDELEQFLKVSSRSGHSYTSRGTDSTKCTVHVLTASDFDWVITVPAIWNQQAKQMMREAAYQVNTSFHILSVCLFTFFMTLFTPTN